MSKVLLTFLLLAFAALCGCSSTKTTVYPGNEQSANIPKDSLRAKFVLNMTDKDGNVQDFDAVLFSVPEHRYRLELTGALGIGVASLLWTLDGWTITFPTEKLYVKGNGYMVGLFNTDEIPLVNIHQVAGLFEGHPLPLKYDIEKVEGDKYFAVEKTGRRFTFKKDGEKIVSLSRIGRDGNDETLVFSNYKTFENVEIPSNIVFLRGDSKYLEIHIKKRTHNKPLSIGTWRLNVPKSFKPVGE